MTNMKFEWRWNPETQTFVLLLYFPWKRKNESTSNVRVERCGCGPKESHEFSWAPLHTEYGLIGCLLSLANIVNGCKRDKKQQLAIKLRRPHRHDLDQSNVYSHSKMIRRVAYG